MYGSNLIKVVSGKYFHQGWMTTALLPLPPSTTINPETLTAALGKGTFLASLPGDDTQAILATGFAIGFATQNIDAFGITGDTAFHANVIGKKDMPIQIGQAVTVRCMYPESVVEFEGLGAAVPGNLVCTTGTGSISPSTARGTALSFLNGCIRIAQSGDVALLRLEEPSLTPSYAGNTRIRARYTQGYLIP